MTLRRRYPDANSLAQRQHWDEATRHVVLDRVHNVPGFVFFDAHERAKPGGTVRACDSAVLPATGSAGADRSVDRRTLRE